MISKVNQHSNDILTENESNSKRPALVFVVIFISFTIFSYFIGRYTWDIFFMSDFSDSFKDENNLQPELPEGLKPEKPSGSSYWYYPTAVLTKEILSRSRIITYRIKDIDRLLNQYGGQKKDWIKKSSEVLLDKNGRMFEYHWYENAFGKYEIKTVPLD